MKQETGPGAINKPIRTKTHRWVVLYGQYKGRNIKKHTTKEWQSGENTHNRKVKKGK
jgi:hypothetical protein